MALRSQTPQDIVITGIGVVSPIGIGLERFTEQLKAGVTGVGVTQLFPGLSSPDSVTAEIHDFNEKVYLKEVRRSIKLMCRDIQLGVASALMAMGDSQIDLEKVDHERLGVEFGANLMLSEPNILASPAISTLQQEGVFGFKGWGEVGFSKMEPLWLLRYLPNMPACHISIATDARGPSNSLTLDEASANVVIGEATRILGRGAADMMITGATGSFSHPIRTLHLALMRTLLAATPPEPEKRSRPFDLHRSGMVVGEGAGTLILETRAHAESRGARIYGRILATGAATCSDPHGNPNFKQAFAKAIESALSNSGLKPEDVGHYNAHGSGMQDVDAAEAQAVDQVFGSYKIPVTAPKSFLGNASAGSGMVELIASLAGVRNGFIPKTLNYDTPDPACPVNVVTELGVKPTNPVFIAMNVTRKGQAAAVVVEAE